MRFTALLVATALAAAGCTDPGQDAAPPASPTPSSADSTDGSSTATMTAASNSTSSTASPGSGPLSNATLPRNVTTFDWALDGTGSRAFEFIFALSGTTSCQDDWSISAPAGQGSPAAFLRDDDGSTSQATGVHSGGETTRTVEPTSYGGSGSQPGSSGERVYRFFIEAGSPEGSDAWSASLRFECEAPYDVAAARVAPVWKVFDVLEMESAFASALAVGATTVAEGSITFDVGEPATAWLWAGGVSQGDWGLSTSDGGTSLAIGPADTLHAADGPAGPWTVTLTGATANGAGVWGAVAGPFADFVPS